MRTKTLVPGLKNSDNVRILFCDAGVSVRMTVKQALSGFGVSMNAVAVEKALKALGGVKLDPGAAGVAACGIAGNWNGIALQVDYLA
jgi:hypothetical protein